MKCLQKVCIIKKNLFLTNCLKSNYSIAIYNSREVESLLNLL